MKKLLLLTVSTISLGLASHICMADEGSTMTQWYQTQITKIDTAIDMSVDLASVDHEICNNARENIDNLLKASVYKYPSANNLATAAFGRYGAETCYYRTSTDRTNVAKSVLKQLISLQNNMRENVANSPNDNDLHHEIEKLKIENNLLKQILKRK